MAKDQAVKKTAEDITREKLNSLLNRQNEIRVELFSVQKQIEVLEAVLKESE